MARRGALIVFEGCDRSGKSTQCKKLAEFLQNKGKLIELMRFPDRTTAIGKSINSYLECSTNMEDHAIHLLFSANRWEAVPKMKKLLESGTTLIVDRYCYSGVAFTAAKQGFDLEWCKYPDHGLPQPDVVFYLNIPVSEASKRAEYGGERYENLKFQERVAEKYLLLKSKEWRVLDATSSVDKLHEQISNTTINTINRVAALPIRTLNWSIPDDNDTNNNNS